MNFRTLDLNLLRVFDVVMTERSVTRAAERLAMTQPAVSNALRRLREATREDLFTPSSTGVTPTRRAEALWPTVRAALGGLREVFEPRAFDPQSDARSFTLAMAVDFRTAVDRHEEGTLAGRHGNLEFGASLQRDVQQADLGRRCKRRMHAAEAAQRKAHPCTGSLPTGTSCEARLSANGAAVCRSRGRLTKICSKCVVLPVTAGTSSWTTPRPAAVQCRPPGSIRLRVPNESRLAMPVSESRNR